MFIVTANDQGRFGDPSVGRVLGQSNNFPEMEELWTRMKNGSISEDPNWDFDKEEYISLVKINNSGEYEHIQSCNLIMQQWHQDIVADKTKRISLSQSK